MIPLFRVGMSGMAGRRVSEVLMSGFIGQGEKVEQFEREFEKLNGFPEGSFVSTSSCTAAIELVLRYLGVGKGHNVITTPMTCIATNAPILNQGATIQWAGVNPWGLINPLFVSKLIDGNTKAIIGVDWTGRLADYTNLKLRGIPVIQDAAHDPLLAHYPKEDLGDYVCFSFGPIKHLTTGDGGGVFVNNPEFHAIVHQLRLLRWYGLDRTSSKDFRCEQDITNHGMKWHMNDINAAIGLANLPGLKDIVESHRRNAAELSAGIDNPYVKVDNPIEPESNYWIYPVRLLPKYRDAFIAHMTDHGVACGRVHARNDKHPAYQFSGMGRLDTTTFDTSQANLPCGWWLRPDDIYKIVTTVNEFVP